AITWIIISIPIFKYKQELQLPQFPSVMIFIRSELSNRIKFWGFKAEFSSIFRKNLSIAL
ncbi:hypothetical protein M5P23_03090, partial [Streptococcus suis]|uniref:hypothetical protein n=1 Tax=Streptococcus suis TaxID=1307 RepID=UPI00201B0489